MDNFDAWLCTSNEEQMDRENYAVEVEQIDIEDEESDQNSIGMVKKSQKTKSYTVVRKLEIVEYAKKVNSNRNAAKKYNITPKMVRDWKSKEAQLRRTRDTVKGCQKKNLTGAGRPLFDKDFDTLLAGWVRERRALKMKVSRAMIFEPEPQQPAVRSRGRVCSKDS